jgi:imidazolonepropionase
MYRHNIDNHVFIKQEFPVSLVLFTNCHVATMHPDGGPYGLIPKGSVVVENGAIAWVGAAGDVPSRFSEHETRDLGGRLVTPGLIDCHTHVVFGGNRAREFEMRLEGSSYEEISRAGGGIVSTVKATREADENTLLADALKRVDALVAEGVSTLEIKSGYGLNQEVELRMLKVARRIADERPVLVKTSFLAAHATPPEYKGRDDAYIDEVCVPALRAAHAAGLVDAVDGFCEGIAFTPAQMARVFDVAKDLGLSIKLHAEQLSNIGGAKLAASYGALSADHLEYLDEAGVQAMAASGSVAVLLPGAFYTLRETRLPPVDLLRKHNVPIAIATDCNPGSSPLASLLLCLNMACTLFRMTPEEALAGVTREAARALGLNDAGVLAAGKRADLAVWNIKHPSELAYRIGFNPLHQRVFAGAS